MKKSKERIKAIALRKKGYSLSEISKTLSVSKSTASVWCRDIVLSKAAAKRISERGNEKGIAALRVFSEKIKRERLKNISDSSKKGALKLGNLSDRDIYCIGLGLYWGEGYKRGSQELGFTNSDPNMIIFFIKWLNLVYGVKKPDLILRVSINEVHGDRIKIVEKFWSEKTNVPLGQFTKSSLIKSISKKSYKNSHTHMGTLRVKVRKGTSLRREILGSIQAIS